jgi:hypothetical protein
MEFLRFVLWTVGGAAAATVLLGGVMKIVMSVQLKRQGGLSSKAVTQ